jgi:hypothetical protein
VAGALAEALGGEADDPPPGSPEGTAPSGPPLTGGEREGFRLAVQGCWVVDPGAPAARSIVTLGFSMTREGLPRTDTIRLLGSEGEGDAQRAFEAARRAVIRCARGGYPLPSDKYEHWREVEITFDPTTMRLR